MSDTFYYNWPRQSGKSTLIRAWREAMVNEWAAQATEAAPTPGYIAFVHADPMRVLVDGEIGAVEGFRFYTSPFGWPPRKLQRSASPRKRARALKWRRSL